MSESCAIPGCQSRSGQTTLFSSHCTSALSQWWKNTPLRVQVEDAGKNQPPAKICIAHFQKDHLTGRRLSPRLKPDAVPTLHLPDAIGSAESVESPISMHEMEPEAPQQMNDNRSKREMICRFCSKTHKDPIKNQLENLLDSEELLQLCLGRGRFLEGLPSGVCDLCFHIVKLAGAFIGDCIKAQEKLQEMFFGATEQMGASFVEETPAQDQTFEHSFAVPEPVISLDYADERSIKYESNDAIQPDELDNNDSQDNDGGYEEENMNEYTGHPILSSTPRPKNQKRYREQESDNYSHDNGGECEKENTNGSLEQDKSRDEQKQQSDLQCTQCNRKFTLKARLKEHIMAIHEQRKHTCEICGKIYNWWKGLARHMKESHKKKLRMPTPKKKETQTLKKGKREKMQTLKKKKEIPAPTYVCKRCHKSFTNVHEYRFHKTTHIGEKMRCPLCDKSFKFEREEAMRNHLRSMHKDSDLSEDVFVQMVFQYQFEARSELDQFRDYMNTHRDERWLCPLCSKDFKWPREWHMKHHFNLVHQETGLSEEEFVQQVVQCTFEASKAAQQDIPV